MAKFKSELPNDIIKQIESIDKNADKMLKEMTQAGAQTVYKNVLSNVPSSWHSSNIMDCIKVTKAYNTPSDDGVATKVALYGYFENKKGERVPAPLVGNVTEYGRSDGTYPRKPFMRKSFKKKQIEDAMLKVQDKYIPKG